MLVNIDKIQALCKERQISQALVCRKLGLGRAYFNDVKRGASSITDERLKLIAEVLNVNVAYLKDETDVISEYKKESPSEMSERDSLVLEAFRSLTDEQQESLLSLMRSMVEKQNDV